MGSGARGSVPSIPWPWTISLDNFPKQTQVNPYRIINTGNNNPGQTPGQIKIMKGDAGGASLSPPACSTWKT
jgi:hypothetical protein